MSEKTACFILFVIICLIFITPAQGTIPNKDNIISDDEFRNCQSMTQNDIQNFLANQNCFLATYKTADVDGVEKLPSEMIYNAAQRYHINPKVILTMLQKEQSIISTSSGKQTTAQLNKAMGYESSDHYGLSKQIDRGTWQLNRNIERIDAGKTTINGWTIGVAKETVDHVIVTPETKATASLYSYNPLAGAGWGGSEEWGANYLFWDIYYNKFEFSVKATSSNSWEFNTPANSEGWLAYNAGILNADTNVQDDGLFIVDPIGPDPWIENNGISIDASSVDRIKIKMSSNCEDNTGAIYFSTAESPGFDEDKKVGFSVSRGSEWYEYDIPISENSNWKGKITALRIDPADFGSESSESHDDTFGFDYIRLSGVPTETDTPSDQDTPSDEAVTPDSPTTPPAPAQSTVHTTTYCIEDLRIELAIAWSRTKKGSTEYYDPIEDMSYCQRFVGDAYRDAGSPPTIYYSAKLAADALNPKDTSYAPPRGAYVFYEWEYQGEALGHVGLSVGGGNIIHVAYNKPIRENHYKDVMGLDYIGWAYPPVTPPINNIYPLAGNLYGSADKNDITGVFNSSTSKFTFGSKSVQFGLDTDIPIIGDWDGDNTDEIGVFRPIADDGISKFYLVTRNLVDLGDEAGAADVCVDFGPYPTNVPITGDWDGDGDDDIGGFNPEKNIFYLYKLDLKAEPPSAKSYKDVPFGVAGDIPFIGDWDRDGKDELGVFRSPYPPYPAENPGTNAFYCDRELTGNQHELGEIGNDGKPKPYTYGDLKDYPVIGDWDGDGDDDIGVYRPHNKKFCKDSTIPADPRMGADIVAVIRTYGSHEGDDDYNPVHDVNSDGVINLSDFVGALKDTIMGMLNSISL